MRTITPAPDYFTGGHEIDDNFTGSTGNNTFNGTAGADSFDLSQGGKDTANGMAGTDTFTMGTEFTNADHLDGGDGTDTVNLTGTYVLTLNATSMLNMEFLVLNGTTNDYSITFNDANVAAAKNLQVLSGSGAGHTVYLNALAETDGAVLCSTGASNDTFLGGDGNDYLQTSGGADTLRGNDGNDLFGFNGGGMLDNNDHVDGGNGTDQLAIGGNYSGGLKFKAATIQNIESFSLSTGDYKFIFVDGNVAATKTMLVDGFLATSINVNAAAETDGHYYFSLSKFGGSVVTGGQMDDTFDFRFNETGGAARSVITGFDWAEDKIKWENAITGIDKQVKTGDATTATLDADLGAIFGAGMTKELGADHAVLFKASGGGNAGQWYLIVDGDGVAGYTAGNDLVVQLNNVSNVGDITTGDFTT
jgi:hypothetical protein